LRLGRSALIQVGAGCGYQGRVSLELSGTGFNVVDPVILVATESVQQRLRVEIPTAVVKTNKVRTGYRWPNADFQGLLPPLKPG